MPDIKPIETLYNGYRFRSRLEARWAVFFNIMDVKWEYEKEGYNLGGIKYLPDFWLPDYRCFIEIKGQLPTDQEIEKIRLLRDYTEYSAAIFWGLPTENWGRLYCYDLTDSGGGSSDWECLLCHDDQADLAFGVLDRRVDRVFYADNCFQKSLLVLSQPPDGYSFWCGKTDYALDCAKQARFEHGESPIINAHRNDKNSVFSG